jgi:hypothetical protein
MILSHFDTFSLKISQLLTTVSLENVSLAVLCCIDTHRRRHTGDDRDKRKAMNQKKLY